MLVAVARQGVRRTVRRAGLAGLVVEDQARLGHLALEPLELQILVAVRVEVRPRALLFLAAQVS